jgi:hypothetical protein
MIEFFGHRHRNSLRSEDEYAFCLSDEKVYFSGSYLFDAQTGEVCTISAVFSKARFACFLTDFFKIGRAVCEDGSNRVEFVKNENGVAVSVDTCGEVTMSIPFPEFPKNVFGLMGIIVTADT